MFKENELKQQKNTIVVTGRLKSKFLETRVASNGSNFITGNFIVESKTGENEVNQIRFDVMAFENQKNYNNIVALMNELNDEKSSLSPEFVDKVRVIGSLETNKYVNKNGEVVENNRFNAISVYKSNTTQDAIDVAEVEMGVVINKVEKKEDGKLDLGFYNVGFRESINEVFMDIEIPEEFVSYVEKYEVGDETTLKFDIKNIAIVSERGGFGDTSTVVEGYKRALVLKGGLEPLRKVSNDEMNRIQTLLKQENDKLEMEKQAFAPQQEVGGGFYPTDDDIPF